MWQTLMDGAEALGAKARGVKQILLRSQVLQQLGRSVLSQFLQMRMSVLQAWQERGRLAPLRSLKERALPFLLQVLKGLDLRERLLYPLMRMLVLLAFLVLERLVQLRSVLMQTSQLLALRVRALLERLRLLAMRMSPLQVLRQRVQSEQLRLLVPQSFLQQAYPALVKLVQLLSAWAKQLFQQVSKALGRSGM
jgi:hypothetical protein